MLKMKKLYLFCSIVIVASLALTACQVREGETVTISGPTTTVTTTTGISWLDIPTYNEFWGTVTTSIGEEFAIVLSQNPRLGLSWYATYDENLLVLLASDFKGYSTSSGFVAGDQYIIFKGLKMGTAEITFIYKQGFPGADIL